MIIPVKTAEIIGEYYLSSVYDIGKFEQEVNACFARFGLKPEIQFGSAKLEIPDIGEYDTPRTMAARLAEQFKDTDN